MTEKTFEYPLTGTATALSLGVTTALSLSVGFARKKYGISAPKTTGDENFEKYFRSHYNTIENLVIFLPSMWLFAVGAKNDKVAGSLGIAWSVGRILYHLGYTQAEDSHKRGYGTAISTLAQWFLVGGSAYFMGKYLKEKYCS
jgi:glutathione S-transferase